MKSVRLPLRELVLPGDGQVDLWLARPEDFLLPGLAAPATASQRVMDRRLRQRFLLRLLLGAYLCVPGRAVRIVRGPSGKPELEQGGLSFNVSHSGPWLAIAVTGGAEVGVDIEYRRPLRRPLELARRFFRASEVASLEPLAEPGLSEAFLHLWTAKEALIKAAGEKVAGNLSRVEVGGAPTLRIHDLPRDWGRDLCLSAPALPAGLVGHLAAASGHDSVNLAELLPPGKTGHMAP